MGMFDTITCAYPLPGGPPIPVAEGEFQTKDLESLMYHYRITEGGSLQLLEILRHEDRSDPAAEKGSMASIIGCHTPVYGDWKGQSFTGELTFYTGNRTGWWEYEATFVSGQLTDIKGGKKDQHYA